MNISDLRKMRQNKGNNAAKISEAFDKMSNKGYSDDRVWKVTTDKDGNGGAVIRFLPATTKGDESDELPFVRVYHHGFKNPKNERWYIENSLTTFPGEADPMSEENSRLWEKGDEASKKLASAQKRKLSYYSNILVISDPKNPENEGKVFLFKYGKKIMDKILEKAKADPAFPDEPTFDVFDIFDGANFKLRQKKVENFPNYDSSAFDAQTELCGGDEEKILEVLNAQYLLKELLARKNFKTYDELKKRVEYVMGRTSNVKSEGEDSGSSSLVDEFEQYTAKKTVEKETETKAKKTVVDADDDDSAEAFFKSIAEETDDDIPY